MLFGLAPGPAGCRVRRPTGRGAVLALPFLVWWSVEDDRVDDLSCGVVGAAVLGAGERE